LFKYFHRKGITKKYFIIIKFKKKIILKIKKKIKKKYNNFKKILWERSKNNKDKRVMIDLKVKKK
jgi:hypothetical protein